MPRRSATATITSGRRQGGYAAGVARDAQAHRSGREAGQQFQPDEGGN
jgi:hypothetical protein